MKGVETMKLGVLLLERLHRLLDVEIKSFLPDSLPLLSLIFLLLVIQERILSACLGMCHRPSYRESQRQKCLIQKGPLTFSTSVLPSAMTLSSKSIHWEPLLWRLLQLEFVWDKEEFLILLVPEECFKGQTPWAPWFLELGGKLGLERKDAQPCLVQRAGMRQ